MIGANGEGQCASDEGQGMINMAGLEDASEESDFGLDVGGFER
jgi:hypothetical protein